MPLSPPNVTEAKQRQKKAASLPMPLRKTAIAAVREVHSKPAPSQLAINCLQSACQPGDEP
jgi:hypothetical protein